AAGRALGQGAAHDHVLDLGGIDLRPLDGGLDDVAAEGAAVGQVEGAAPGLGEAGAGGGDDGCVDHARSCEAKLEPAAASFVISGAGSQAERSPCGFALSRLSARATL